MKNIFKFASLVALAAAVFTGCSSDELDTDQYGSGVTFAAFAPNPVMRGSEMRILGSNLQDIKEIRLPGDVTITDYTVVTSGDHSEIRFQVPLTGPEPGQIVIVDKSGNEYTSFSSLTFTEPIELLSFSPASALSGDVITITGEYLNNVQEVIFGGDVYVTEFISQSRSELKVSVPGNALTGFIRVGDVNELVDDSTVPNVIFSETELTIGDPTVVTASKATYKSGDLMTVTGTHLDMIETINLEGYSNVTFSVSADGTAITFNLPPAATDGNITLVSYAGVEFDGGEIETVTVADLAIESLASDGRYKAGSDVQISGSDLDLVTAVQFNNADPSWVYKDGKIIARIPAAAKDGSVTVTLASGKQAMTPAIEVVKPVITGTGSTSGVAGKDRVVLTGTDLDLASTVTIGDDANGLIDCDTYDISGTEQITVTIPREGYTGVMTVTAESGYSTKSGTIEVSYDEAISIVFASPSFAMGKTVSFSGTNLQNIESIEIKGKKVTSYVTRSDDAMSFFLPDGVGPGVYRLAVTLSDGTSLTWPVPFEVTAPYTETYIWQGSFTLSGWNNSSFGDEDAFAKAGIKEGDIVRIYYTAPEGAWWMFQLYDGHWGGLSIPELDGGQAVSSDNAASGSTFFSFEVTASIAAQLSTIAGWGGAILCNGDGGVEITAVSLIQFGATETTVWEGSAYTGDYAENLCLGGEDDWVDNGLEEGSEVRIYFTTTLSEDWQIQVFDGHWSAMSELGLDGDNSNQFNASNSPDALSKGYVSFKATGGIYTKLTTHAWWGNAIILQGKEITVTRLAFQ